MDAKHVDQLRDAIWRFDPYGINDDRSEVPAEYEDLLAEVLHLMQVGDFESSLRTWVNLFVGRFDLVWSPTVVADLSELEDSIREIWSRCRLS